MAKLSPQQVKHVAQLAHLTLTPSEIILYQDQLSRIIDYVDQLGKVNTQRVPPTFQVIGNLTNVVRSDQTTPSLTQTQALSASPKTHNGYVVTNAVLDV